MWSCIAWVSSIESPTTRHQTKTQTNNVRHAANDRQANCNCVQLEKKEIIKPQGDDPPNRQQNARLRGAPIAVNVHFIIPNSNGCKPDWAHASLGTCIQLTTAMTSTTRATLTIQAKHFKPTFKNCKHNMTPEIVKKTNKMRCIKHATLFEQQHYSTRAHQKSIHLRFRPNQCFRSAPQL